MRRAVMIGGALAGLGLFVVAFAVHAADPVAVASRVRAFGVAFVWILLLAGVRLAARAAAWSVCARRGSGERLPFPTAFSAGLVGEAAGSLSPLGVAASEPAKVLWVRRHLGTLDAAASLAVETLIYSLTTALVLAAGTIVWVAVVAPSARPAVLGGGLVGFTAVAAFSWSARRASGRQWAGRLAAWLDARAAGKPVLRTAARAVRRTADMLRMLLSRGVPTLALVALLEVAFQVAAVAEVWVTLILVGVPHVTFLQAFLLEYANRVVTVAFKFVPMRLGVDELGSGAMASVLGYAGAVGVTLAVARKARVACWSAVGLLLVAVRAIGAGERPPDAEAVAPSPGR